MALAIAYFAYDKFILSGSREAAEAARQVTQQAAEQTNAEPDKSVAVLPFVDMSPDKDQDYFTDGLTENLLNALAQWGDADNAMSWLERGYVIRDPGLQYLGHGFLFAPIKEDPRFKIFLKKMNF